MGETFAFIVFLLIPLLSGGLLLFFIRRWRAGEKSGSIGRVIVGNLLVLFFLLSLVFIAGETYYRFLYDTTDSLGQTLVTQQWLHRYYVTNSAGFRDNIEYAMAVEPGKRRISFLGDSFVAGHGIKSVEDRFANRIRAAHPEWEVHTLAKLGWDTGNELEAMTKYLGEGYQVDEVVLVYCLNDVSDMLPGWRISFQKVLDQKKQENWIERNSYWINLLECRLQARQNPYLTNYYSFVDEGYRDPYWGWQQQRLTELRELVQSHGGKLSVVTFPFLHSLGPNYGFRPVHQMLDQFWIGLNVPHIDLLSVYSNLPPEKLVVNHFDAHPNEYASELATREIEKFVLLQVKTNTSALKP